MLEVNTASVQIEGITLIDKIDISINSGEVVALVGPNGAGKSTLLRAIAGEQALTQGHISFHGKPTLNWDKKKCAQHLAVLPQSSVLNFPFTGREVVQLARTPHETGLTLDNQIVDEVLEYLDATYLAERIYTRLSGGEQQRIQLARVLAQIWQPAEKERLLLLDEPSSSFDLAHQQLLVSAIRKLARSGIGILVVLHDLNMALNCADKIAVLCCGQLRAFGTPDDVLNEDLLKEVFGVHTRFMQDPETGQRFVGLINEHQQQTSAQ